MRRSIVCLTMAGLLLALGCGKAYRTRIDVRYRTPPRLSTSPRPEPPSVRAAFARAAAELSILCKPDDSPWTFGELSREKYVFLDCTVTGQGTRVSVALRDEHMALELFQIGGWSEPASFRRFRLTLTERLTELLPQFQVTARFDDSSTFEAPVQIISPSGRPTTG